MKTENTLIGDGQRLVGATSGAGHKIPVYDDGFGPLWIHRDSMGISGIVRAQTWQDAYSICEDEFFPEASETLEELLKEYGKMVSRHRVIDQDGKVWESFKKIPSSGHAGWIEHPPFEESFGYRPSGPNVRDKLGHGIYAKDLNGDALDLLTPTFAQALGITLKIQDW